MALHVSPPQQPCPSAPQGQSPFMQAPPPGQAATQVPPCELQQPLVHALPSQQGWPAPPHCTHRLPSQARPDPVQV
jgi:hypothetical protein